MISGLRPLGDAAYRVNAVEEGREFHRTPQRLVNTFPTGEVGQRGVHFFVGEHGHKTNGTYARVVLVPVLSKAFAQPARIARKLDRSSRELTASITLPPARAGWV